MTMKNRRPPLARVVIIGTSCAGKTIFARSLADVLNSPHVELDAFFWNANWVQKATEEFRALTAQAIVQDRWVMDGNYGVARDLVWSRATVVIWLNYNLPLVLWRALTRTIHRVVTRRELFSGNRESLRQAFFSRESIIWWIITTFHARRKNYRNLIASGRYPLLAYIEFRKPSETTRFLAGLEKTYGRSVIILPSQLL
jgi:adenylate kinase family enzyme